MTTRVTRASSKMKDQENLDNFNNEKKELVKKSQNVGDNGNNNFHEQNHDGHHSSNDSLNDNLSDTNSENEPNFVNNCNDERIDESNITKNRNSRISHPENSNPQETQTPTVSLKDNLKHLKHEITKLNNFKYKNKGSISSFKLGYVNKKYTALDCGELGIEEGKVVEVIKSNENWLCVMVCGEKRKGCVPKDCVSIPDEIEIYSDLDDGKVSSKEGIMVEVIKFELKCLHVKVHADYRKRLVPQDRFPVEMKPFYVGAFICLLAGTYYCVQSYYGSTQSDICQGKPHFECLDVKINNLERKLPMLSSKVWITLTACLTSVLNNEHPCIILLLYDGKENFSGFLTDIGDLSKEMLNQINTKSNVIHRKGSELTSDRFFTQCKQDLEDNKIMLIDKMESIPGNILEFFHSFCDVYDPAVRQAVIVFLLNHQNINVDPSKNDATFAIDVISSIWKDSIHEDIINPLAIRISENVLRL